LDFINAESLEHAVEVLADRGGDITVLAGGTDVMVDYLRGDSDPSALLHVRPISALEGLAANGRTEIGALTTHWSLTNDAHIRSEHASLAEAAGTVGGRQTQNVGTLAGNVVNASPAADTIPPLLVANAEVSLASATGTRRLPLSEFLIDRKLTARRPDELMTTISLERPAPGTGEVYLKLGRRSSMEVAIVGLAARIAFSDEGVAGDVRLAVCSAAPTPFRASEAESLLTGTSLPDEAVAEAGRLLQSAAAPIDDARASAAYRSRVLPALLRRAVAACRDRAGSVAGEVGS
jgi:carbon-monoxide dehydrogenase medium subunit